MASDKQMNIGGSGTGQSTVSVNIVNDLKVNSKSVPVFEEANVTGSEVLAIQNADTLAGKSLTELLLMIYPVGSIYMSASSTNPGVLFGGTWVAWGQGRVPVGVNADDTAYNGSDKTGGNATVTPSGSVADATQGGTISNTTAGGTVGGHTLTVAETPAHTHTGPSHTHNATTSNAGGHTHEVWIIAQGWSGWQDDANYYPHYYGFTSWVNPPAFGQSPANRYAVFSGQTRGVGDHAHSLTTSASGDGATSSVGGNGSHNHGFTGTAHSHTFTGSAHSHTFTGTAQSTIQPYVTCYMWKRTA